jgi:hypothetical protein
MRTWPASPPSTLSSAAVLNLFLGGTILGIALIVTCFIGIIGIIQRNHITIGLVITNYVLLVDAVGIVIIGTFVWFFTLKERDNYSALWDAATPDVRRTLQDQVRYNVTLSTNSPLTVT